MNSDILLIGNSGLKRHGIDGQTAKVRLYLKKIQDEGFKVNFIDLEIFLKKPFSTLHSISEGIKTCARIVLISASRGCRFLIPFINKRNRKFHKPFILPLIGSSVLHCSVDKLSDEEKNDFLINGNYSLCKQNKRMARELSKLTYILPETKLLVKIFEQFYGLTNVHLLNNFRDHNIHQKHIVQGDILKIVFLSRVMEIKGIFDILDVVKDLHNNGYKLQLDVFGKKLLDNHEERIFNSYIDEPYINYCGVIDNSLVCETILNYDLFVFPTRCMGEGTPGVISESLLAGTPILTSEFPQAKYLLNNGTDSIFYKMFDKEDLKNKLLSLLSNKDLLFALRDGAKKSGNRFSYEFERGLFLKYVCGKE